jgi:carboxypeptidase Q
MLKELDMRFPEFTARRATRAAVAILLGATMAAPVGAQEPVDLATIERIKTEAMEHSQVMDIMSWLTDVHGPRLTGSPTLRDAERWTVGKLKEWGLSNPRLEQWGPFGRGWSTDRFAFQALAPVPFPIIAAPRAWSLGTAGAVRGDAMIVRIEKPEDLEQYKGKLRGKFVLVTPPRAVTPSVNALASRLTDEQLAEMAAPLPPRPQLANRPAGPQFRPTMFSPQGAQGIEFFAAEGVAAVLLPARGDGGTVFTDNGNPGARQSADAPNAPYVHVAIEHYGRIWRTLEKDIPVTLELDMKNTFHDADLNEYNVIAEIPGTDPRLKDETVMLGGHFDSWHAGTGATDNAAGSAVMLEAVRIIQALGLKPKRTIRIALWTGEEQGLLGSRAYVRQQFRDSTGTKPAFDKFSAYYNIDNGTGIVRGVYLQGNEAVRPIFDAWMAPFRSMGMTTITPRNTGGTDHLAFDGAGLPGFQFIQDPVEYGTRTHHSNQDVFERIQEPDMEFNAAVLASFVWQTAQRPEKLPRKPAP